jgi:serine/threonine protein kinase
MANLVGRTILHYRIIEQVGQGGMGVVYKAEDAKLEREVAIKILPRQIGANDEERQRFKIEAQAAAALNRPNIATIHAIEEHDDELFIAGFENIGLLRNYAQIIHLTGQSGRGLHPVR